MMDIFLNFDFAVLDFIAENIRCAFLDPIMFGLSFFADKGLGWLALALIFLIPRKTRSAGVIALCAIVFSLLFGEFLIKNLVCRERPFVLYESFHGCSMPFTLNMGEASGFSFPSGHTSSSFAAAVAFYRINRKVGIAATVLAVLVAFSRLYNYVHYPTDVIAGMILGIASGLLFLFLFKKLGWDNKLSGVKK